MIWVSLQDLTLAGNRLRQLPEELAKLKNLKNLQAAGNLLDSLPQSFTQLTNLSVKYHYIYIEEILDYKFSSICQYDRFHSSYSTYGSP